MSFQSVMVSSSPPITNEPSTNATCCIWPVGPLGHPKRQRPASRVDECLVQQERAVGDDQHVPPPDHGLVEHERLTVTGEQDAAVVRHDRLMQRQGGGRGVDVLGPEAFELGADLGRTGRGLDREPVARRCRSFRASCGSRVTQSAAADSLLLGLGPALGIGRFRDPVAHFFPVLRLRVEIAHDVDQPALGILGEPLAIPLRLVGFGRPGIGREADDSLGPLGQLVGQADGRADLVSALPEDRRERRCSVQARSPAQAVFGLGPRVAAAGQRLRSGTRNKRKASEPSGRSGVHRDAPARCGDPRVPGPGSRPVRMRSGKAACGRSRSPRRGRESPPASRPARDRAAIAHTAARPARRQPDQSGSIETDQLMSEQVNDRTRESPASRRRCASAHGSSSPGLKSPGS